MYAAALLPFATRIVEAVHDESHATLLELIGRALALDNRPDDIDPHVALITVLAAMVDPAAGLNKTLGWVRHLSPVKMAHLFPDEDYDTSMAVEGVIPARELPRAKRLDVVRILTSRGLTADQIAIRTGLDERTIARARHDAGLTKGAAA
jgi:hypothetical protein